MKKFILTICLIMGIATSQTVRGDEQNTDRDIIVQDKVKKFGPRSVVLLPVCRYNGSHYSVVVEFPDDDISFTAMIINTSTGEQWFERGDNGYCEVFVSGESGTYRLFIDTASGDSYEGDFTIE
ncbi:hypothetical protein [uncultured Alistipes sp.]|uniref:hypothetical protein n=1 Tax=uncultured Alistipes sp. TaxID=538949 RepID=UPI00272AD812|nr:hypothetical protein [uncultured Alistipes sp.]